MFTLKDELYPRKWQRYALEAWSFQMKGIVKVVTGGGKTIFSLLCMNDFFVKNPNGICVIVVPTIALMDQWLVEIIENTNVPEESIAMYGGGNKPSGGEIIHLMVVNTARQKVEKISSDQPTMLIVDECHRAATAENSKSLQINTVATLGLSATPERQYDEGFEEKMDSLQDAVDGFDQMLDSLDPKLRDALNVVATDYLLVICEAVERYLQEEHA